MSKFFGIFRKKKKMYVYEKQSYTITYILKVDVRISKEDIDKVFEIIEEEKVIKHQSGNSIAKIIFEFLSSKYSVTRVEFYIQNNYSRYF